MADKYLNLNVLTYFWNRLKTYFVLKDDQTDIEFYTSSSPYSARITQHAKSISFSNTDDGVSLYALDGSTSTGVITKELVDKNYVDANGGKIDKIKVNGVEQTITNKEVNLTVPTKVGDLTNDSNFQNDTDVTSAINNALANNGDPYMPESDIQQLIDDELAGITGIEFEVVQTLPTSGTKGTIYLVHKDGAGQDVYDEYIWLTPQGQTAHWEKIGATDIDLSGYWSKSELVAITTAEIDNMMAS